MIWSGLGQSSSHSSRFNYLTIHMTNQECLNHNMTKDKLPSQRKPHSSSLSGPDIYSLFQSWTSGSSFSSHTRHSVQSTPTYVSNPFSPLHTYFHFCVFTCTASLPLGTSSLPCCDILSHPCDSSGANHITLIQERRPG